MAKKSSVADVQPLGNRVLVKPLDESALEKTTAAGIIIPETAKEEKPQQGTVVAVGPGEVVDGQKVVPEVKKGDTVVFSKFGYDEIKVGDDEYYILKGDNILAVIK